MIKRAKRLHLPTFRAMVLDLGNPHARDLGEALGVHPHTVERWRRHDRAPRPVMLALFWLTSWGQSELDCDLHNRATHAGAHLAAAVSEAERLRRELARVLAAGDFGSANRPTFQPAAVITTGRRTG